MVLCVLQKVSYRQEGVWNMQTTQSSLQDVHGHKETNKPGKLYHEGQKDHRDGEWSKRRTEMQEDQRNHIKESEGEQL